MAIDIDMLNDYFKYISDDKDVINGIFRNHEIRFTQPAELNDPLEFKPQIYSRSESVGFYKRYRYRGTHLPSHHFFLQGNIIQRYINDIGILSLTKQPLDYKMWNYYSNGHKGVVIGFKEDFLKHSCFQSNKDSSLKVTEIEYVKDYKVDVDDYKDSGEINYNEMIQEITSKKTDHWDYEKEFRVVRPLADHPKYQPRNEISVAIDRELYLFDFSLDCLSSVTFGVNTKSEIKREILNACRNEKIVFYQAILIQEDGVKMALSPISSFGGEDEYLQLKPQIFTTQAKQFSSDRDTERINKLDDIPYYLEFKPQIDGHLAYMDEYRGKLIEKHIQTKADTNG